VNKKLNYELSSDGTYVIAGGFGGIGLTIATWLIDRGVKSILLLSRSGKREREAMHFISDSLRKGIRFETPACDITDLSSLQCVLKRYKVDLPPIKGCFQAAMVLQVRL